MMNKNNLKKNVQIWYGLLNLHFQADKIRKSQQFQDIY